MGNFKKETGQVLLILIIIITVSVAIVLAIIQKSLLDVSTATKVEQSSRAFSAAEAGIERALSSNSNSSFTVNLSNDSSSVVNGGALLPSSPSAGSLQVALEYPPLAKEDVAYVWLANWQPNTSPIPAFYQQNQVKVYWGTANTSDKPAIEVTIVYYDSSSGYGNYKKFYDPDSTRAGQNGFTPVTCSSVTTNTILGDNRSFYCSQNIVSIPGSYPVLVQARLLYNSTSQPFAVQSSVVCPSGASSCDAYSLPAQAQIYTATGVSGQTQRKVQVFKLSKVVPPFFNYSIFSVSKIEK